MKYAKTRPFGHPAALISPKSFVLCFIVKKTIKLVITVPIVKIKIPTKSKNCAKMADRPVVIISAVDATPKPTRSLMRIKKSVEATLNVTVATVRVVCSFLRNRSFTGKKVSLILARQPPVFQAHGPVGKLH
ncbi:MAG: hypothetical protein R3319_04565 [Candidatus Bathyarchaeia archaeon]|nr:hypothetical protein [Candidatus Bathyarchaeia archaeon]